MLLWGFDDDGGGRGGGPRCLCSPFAVPLGVGFGLALDVILFGGFLEGFLLSRSLTHSPLLPLSVWPLFLLLVQCVFA